MIDGEAYNSHNANVPTNFLLVGGVGLTFGLSQSSKIEMIRSKATSIVAFLEISCWQFSTD